VTNAVRDSFATKVFVFINDSTDESRLRVTHNGYQDIDEGVQYV